VAPASPILTKLDRWESVDNTHWASIMDVKLCIVSFNSSESWNVFSTADYDSRNVALGFCARIEDTTPGSVTIL
jgi:hypothetical protein